MESKPQYLVVAAAKGIQDFVLRSDKLKEMVGASELVDQVPQSLLEETLKHLSAGAGSNRFTVLSRTAGSVRVLFETEATAREFLRLWPALVAAFAPGMELVQALTPCAGDLMTAISRAEERLIRHRNQPGIVFPVAAPVIAYSRRTGLPAVTERRENAGDKPAAMDGEALRKRQMADTAQNSLLNKIVPAEFNHTLQGDWRQYWSVDLNRLVGEDNNYVGVVHIDANGLGEAVMSLVRNSTSPANGSLVFYRDFCRAIERATERAAQQALQPLLARHLSETNAAPETRSKTIPFRPLVCAGEDFTFVIGARYAAQFTRDYLAALENASRDEFAKLGKPPPGFPTHLTACAGLVFCKRSYPFAQAYDLAERLCGFSKQAVERKRSALTFIRLKSSRIESTDYEDVRKELFCGPNADAELTMNPYLRGAAESGAGATIANLAALVESVKSEKMPRGGLREMVAEAYQSKAAATRSFERVSQILGDREPDFRDTLLTRLGALTGHSAQPGIVQDVLWDRGKPPRTPLYDALELASLGSLFSSPPVPPAEP